MTPRPAEFTVEETSNPRDPMYPIRAHVCWCGWSTRKKDSSLYGKPNALAMALLAHRIAHLEGRIPPEVTLERMLEDGLIGMRLNNVLERNRITSLKQVTDRSEQELLNLINFGDKMLEELNRALAHHGLTLRE